MTRPLARREILGAGAVAGAALALPGAVAAKRHASDRLTVHAKQAIVAVPPVLLEHIHFSPTFRDFGGTWPAGPFPAI